MSEKDSKKKSDLKSDLNAKQNLKPTFEPIFGDSWKDLTLVLKKRYSNRSYSKDEVVVDGILDVHVSKWMKFLSPMLRFCGALVPYEGKDIPVTVRFNSHTNSDVIGFNRHFKFTTRKPYFFRSKLKPVGKDGVIEFMKFGLGWKMRYAFEDGKAKLLHNGYIWRIFGIDIPLPFYWILGKGYAYEQAVPGKPNEFDMYFDITHPWFGNVFGYKGRFSVSKSIDESIDKSIKNK